MPYSCTRMATVGIIGLNWVLVLYHIVILHKAESHHRLERDLFKFSFLHIELVKLLLTTLQLFQQVLVQILQLVVFPLFLIRLQRQTQLNEAIRSSDYQQSVL